MMEQQLRKELDVQESSHSRKQPFQCTYCKSSFSQKIQLEIHMRRHNFKCEDCNMAFMRKFDYLEHYTLVHGDKIPQSLLECKYCPYKTSFSMELYHHAKGHKPHNLNEKQKSKTENVYECHSCCFQTTIGLSYFKHLKLHSTNIREKYQRETALHQSDETKKGNLLECKYCSFQTRSSHRFHIHGRSHSQSSKKVNGNESSAQKNPCENITKVLEQKQFQCQYCVYKTNTPEDLSVHLGLHANQKFIKMKEPENLVENRTFIKLLNKGSDQTAGISIGNFTYRYMIKNTDLISDSSCCDVSEKKLQGAVQPRAIKKAKLDVFTADESDSEVESEEENSYIKIDPLPVMLVKNSVNSIQGERGHCDDLKTEVEQSEYPKVVGNSENAEKEQRLRHTNLRIDQSITNVSLANKTSSRSAIKVQSTNNTSSYNSSTGGITSVKPTNNISTAGMIIVRSIKRPATRQITSRIPTHNTITRRVITARPTNNTSSRSVICQSYCNSIENEGVHHHMINDVSVQTEESMLQDDQIGENRCKPDSEVLVKTEPEEIIKQHYENSDNVYNQEFFIKTEPEEMIKQDEEISDDIYNQNDEVLIKTEPEEMIKQDEEISDDIYNQNNEMLIKTEPEEMIKQDEEISDDIYNQNNEMLIKTEPEEMIKHDDEISDIYNQNDELYIKNEPEEMIKHDDEIRDTVYTQDDNLLIKTEPEEDNERRYIYNQNDNVSVKFEPT